MIAEVGAIRYTSTSLDVGNFPEEYVIDDMVLLGAHGLEGLNLRIDLGRRELVPAGPVPVAAAA